MTEEEISQAYDDYFNSMEQEWDNVANELVELYQITLQEAKKISTDVWYFRTRSRWTKALEKQLVIDSVNGIFHNMNEYPTE